MLEWLREERAKLWGRLEALEEGGKVREELVALARLLLDLAQRVAGELEELRDLRRQVEELREQLKEEDPPADPPAPADVPPVPPPAPVNPDPPAQKPWWVKALF